MSPAPPPLPGRDGLRAVLTAWLPLTISFELMMLEGPVLQGSVSRLPVPDANLAAWGLTMSLSLLVESPIIMLLATAIALVRDGDSYRALRNFVLLLCAACTALAGLLAFTPLLELVAGRVMEQPAALVAAARPALQIMLFWTAAIGWRRFYQGVLIRNDAGRLVSYGTAVRLLAIAGVCAALTAGGRLPGVQVAAWGIMAGVAVEAVVTTLFALPIVRARVLPQPSAGSALTLPAIWRFHAPLAATTLLTLLAQPMTQAALARMPGSDLTLPAWPVTYMILLILRGFGLSLQEVTVARQRQGATTDGEGNALFRFAVIVGGLTSVAALVLAVTPLLDAYLGGVLRLPERLWPEVRVGTLAGVSLPLFTALGSWARGLLVAGGTTDRVYRGMLVSLTTHALLLVAGVLLRLPGLPVATVALTVATLAEYAYLRRGR